MCGIAGLVGSNIDIEDLKKMLAKQKHRGPDNTGIYEDKDHALLGHNRLSIIDLSEDAHQPFTDNTGRYYLTFNGEIYNYLELKRELKGFYQFKTSSDTEVLIAAYIKWGKNCLDKLNGMFSFAIWDSTEKTLFAARDRFGVKPFHYIKKNDSLFFASEIKALKVLANPEPDNEVWAGYFAFGSYGMPDQTFYKGINQIPAGHYLEFHKGTFSISQWYHFEHRINEKKLNHNLNEAIEFYFQLLKDSLSLRFRSDVPIGFNISGGVDSSLLLSLVNLFEDKKQIQAFTFFTGNQEYDEIEWAEGLISAAQNPLNKVKFSASEVNDTLDFISHAQDEPFGGIPTLAYSKIFKKARENGIKVLLDGQGMDEQWAGYDYYLNNQKTNTTIQGTGSKSPFKTNILSKYFLAKAEKAHFPEPFDDNLQNLQYRDLFYTKLPRALRFNDRISMAYSTELREPFLDHRMVEFAFAQPTEFKIQNGIQKFMLREILAPLVPKNISHTPKRPLQTPQREWLANELKGMVFQKLEDLKTSPHAHWFNHKAIEKNWKDYLNGDRASSFHIWQLINAATVLN